jgi:hypothetical protein
MILVRLVFQAKFGKVNEVLAGFKQTAPIVLQAVGQNARGCILTDLGGPFNTVVQEIEVESLAEWERLRAALFSNPQFQQAQVASADLIESGRTEFYTIEA